ncbi:MAG: hypothetical protein P4L53_08910 [Candidatus Obscuribacterales bacterium]|nr:hypothetical protein [Candidatus Obscuribacterales bacterium]
MAMQLLTNNTNKMIGFFHGEPEAADAEHSAYGQLLRLRQKFDEENGIGVEDHPWLSLCGKSDLAF